MAVSKKFNSYIVMDFETGGLDCIKNPIIEFAAIAIKGHNYEQILAYDNIIKPYDEKLVYEPDAERIHGISKDRAFKSGVPLSQFGEDFITICQEANVENSKIAKPCLVGHNIGFDIPFLCNAAERCKIDLSKYLDGFFDHKKTFQPAYIDTIKMMKNADGGSPDAGIKFSLTECCRRFGIEITDAHHAMNDVIPTKELFIQLMTRIRSTGGNTSNINSLGIDRARKKFRL